MDALLLHAPPHVDPNKTSCTTQPVSQHTFTPHPQPPWSFAWAPDCRLNTEPSPPSSREDHSPTPGNGSSNLPRLTGFAAVSATTPPGSATCSSSSSVTSSDDITNRTAGYTTGRRSNNQRTGPAVSRASKQSSSALSIHSHAASQRSRASNRAAMPGRPPNKRPAEDGDGNESPSHDTKMKLPRLDRGNHEDFSSVVKNRLSQYTRTGQACDRCKVRKIRCDALPEGCSHCINLSLDCYVTDRVTGRTERRGYMQELEREKNSMIAHIRDLEKLLADKGIDVKPWQGAAWAQYPPDVSVDDMGNAVRTSTSRDTWTQVGSLWIKNYNASAQIVQTAATPARPGNFKPSFPRNQLPARSEDYESHLGVGRDNAPLSSINGTQLTILGTTIDTTSFDAPDVDEPPEGTQMSMPLYNKSVQAFLQSTMGVNPPIHADLPSRDDAFQFVNWYFITVSTFLPLLHKPTILQLLTRIYDDAEFKPSIPEQVIVHMIFAIIYFHYGVRNWQQTDRRNQLNDCSNKHYHFALNKVYDLYSSRELVAVQALALIASHTRAFPKPGCGTIIAHMALQRALELNLHRARKPEGGAEGGTNLQHELRKRTWWVILAVVVAVNGRRGSPLPIAVEEFDVDFPEAIADELLTDEGVDTSRNIPCPFQAGLAGFRIAPIYMEMYANIYSVRRDVDNYVNIVDALEAQLREWEDQLPDALKINLDHLVQIDHTDIAALYVKTFALELRFCLRHPSVSMTSDKKVIAENTRICEDTAREFLHCVQHIQKMKALDTTWYQMSIYAGCIFSMLVAHWERRLDTTPEELTRLRGEMNSWMDILKETSWLLGSGPGIPTQIGLIIDRTMGWIEHDMRFKGVNKTSVAVPDIKQEPQVQPAVYQAAPAAATILNGTIEPKDYYQEAANTDTSYSTLTYGNQSQSSGPQPTAYETDTALFYNTSSQAAADAAAAAATTVGVPDGSSQANALAFSSQAGQHLGTQAPTDMMWHARGNTWQDWAAAIAHTQDRYSASALLALGNGRTHSHVTPSMIPDGTDGHGTTDMGVVPHGAQWPLIMFDHNTASGS